jgi:hypothetical protein
VDGATRGLFGKLDSSGRFFRDNALGRIFHPGALSFREICDSDSLHVAVLPGNRVSVHVDRVSPLLVGTDGRCRYSVVRAVLHNLGVAAEAAAGLLLRRPARPRCQLDCEIVWVPDEEPADGPGQSLSRQ